ncbi:MAG: TetR/AcrR family transcriptional regulator [Epsilonproteobacteria bacterium]|nr:TetR/AcrR family transcriptional regulator [Campylobacterota bacterium]
MKEKIRSKVLAYKKELILEEAGKYIEDVGYNALKINDLSKKCGISVGQIYQLFESKEKLFYEYVLHQINKFYLSLQESCKDITSPKEKLLVFTKMKLDIFKQKRKVIQDPIAGDPLFFMKLNNKNPSVIIQEFLTAQFKELDKDIKLKNDNYLQLAFSYNAYVLGHIEYCFNEFPKNRCDEKLAKDILDTFLHGAIES